MKAYFRIGRAKTGCDHILRVGEVCQYQYDNNNDLWDTRIGDGKTPIKDLPPLASYDIYTRVSQLEKEIEKLKNERN